MEYVNSIAHSYVGRMETQYQEINENIGRLINDLGERVQRQLISLEERALLAYKENLLSTQNEFRELKEGRNDETIKQNTLALKSSHERAYQEATEKAVEMNRLYDKLKLDFKHLQEHSHQLQLQLRFLGKQTRQANTKAQYLDAEIKALQQRREKETVNALQRNQSCKKITLKGKQGEQEQQRQARLYQRRLRDKIQHLKQFIDIMEEQESELQRIFGKFQFDSCRSDREKGNLFMQIFQDKEFKRFIYGVLFSKRQTKSTTLQQ